MYFINTTQSNIQAVLKKITQKRLNRAFMDKGYPFPTDANKYVIITDKNKANLCYYYGSKPTVILELLPRELPVNNWRLYLD